MISAPTSPHADGALPPEFLTALGLSESPWMMSASERLVITGILQTLRPATALEFGYRLGGLTAWLSKLADRVTTVDIDAHVLGATDRFPNVEPLHMTTEAAAERFLAEGRRFDLCVIDADHSARGAETDLRNALKFARVILMHDTSNPECRAGYERALAGVDVFRELDLVDGHIQPDGLWGGLGLVLPEFGRGTARTFTEGRSNFPLLAGRFHRSFSVPALKSLAKSVRRTLGGSAG